MHKPLKDDLLFRLYILLPIIAIAICRENTALTIIIVLQETTACADALFSAAALPLPQICHQSVKAFFSESRICSLCYFPAIAAHTVKPGTYRLCRSTVNARGPMSPSVMMSVVILQYLLISLRIPAAGHLAFAICFASSSEITPVPPNTVTLPAFLDLINSLCD